MVTTIDIDGLQCKQILRHSGCNVLIVERHAKKVYVLPFMIAIHAFQYALYPSLLTAIVLIIANIFKRHKRYILGA